MARNCLTYSGTEGEAIDTVRPQEFWFRRHPRLGFHLISLGIGSIYVYIGFAAFQLAERFVELPELSPASVEKMRRYLWAMYVFVWFSRWLAGIGSAFEVRRWLLSLWPNIELDFGSEHLNIEKKQRNRLMSVVTLIVFPIVTNIIFDLITLV